MKRNLLIVFLSLTVSLSYADNWLIRFMKQLGETDTTYIEPQHYPGMLMLQNSYTFDRISLDDGKDKLVFAPDVSVGVGPFGGYKFFFAGYTVDMKSFFKSKDRTNLVFSIFTNPFVIDIYYRKAGNDFKLREITDPELKWLEGMDCSAITTRNFGFSFSYILNHKRYSAPAAFGQSTNQRRSAGSLILGAGYMRSKFDFNLADMVYDMVKKSINDGTFDQMVLAEDIDTDEPDDDEDLIMTRNARFNTFSLTAGYGYNWAFAHNWLLGAAVFVNPLAADADHAVRRPENSRIADPCGDDGVAGGDPAFRKEDAVVFVEGDHPGVLRLKRQMDAVGQAFRIVFGADGPGIDMDDGPVILPRFPC